MNACFSLHPGPNGEDVPPIFIDRAGAKVGLIEQHSRSSKASLNLVLEQVRMKYYGSTASPCPAMSEGFPCLAHQTAMHQQKGVQYLT